MKIPLTINGEKTVIEASADKKLIDALIDLKLLDSKKGCESGSCGACTVLLNGKPVPSCMIPVSILKEHKIITLENFRESETYTNIMKGFTKAGIKLCGRCNAGKIFAAKTILDSSLKPTRENILHQVRHLSTCCTDTETLIDGIIYAYNFNIKR